MCLRWVEIAVLLANLCALAGTFFWEPVVWQAFDRMSHDAVAELDDSGSIDKHKLEAHVASGDWRGPSQMSPLVALQEGPDYFSRKLSGVRTLVFLALISNIALTMHHILSRQRQTEKIENSSQE